MQSPKRTHFSQLPDGGEIREIMAIEAKRPLATGKESSHFVSFRTIVRLLEHYEEPADYFVCLPAGQDALGKEADSQAQDLIGRLAEKIGADSDPPLFLLDALYDYLSVSDSPEPADLMFVFGSPTLHRIERAAELFHAGFAPNILISGGGPHYRDLPEPEAQRLARHIRALGVPQDVIILETTSISMADNVRSSLNQLDDLGVHPSSFLIVNSPYSQRRGWALFKKYLPDGIRVSTAVAPTRDEYRRDQWYRNETGLRVILNEPFKLRISVALNTA